MNNSLVLESVTSHTALIFPKVQSSNDVRADFACAFKTITDKGLTSLTPKGVEQIICTTALSAHI